MLNVPRFCIVVWDAITPDAIYNIGWNAITPDAAMGLIGDMARSPGEVLHIYRRDRELLGHDRAKQSRSAAFGAHAISRALDKLEHTDMYE
jgi:hypothetical protein